MNMPSSAPGAGAAAIAPSAARPGDVPDLVAGLLTAALLAVFYTDGTGLTRVLLTLGFACFVPGRAIVSNWNLVARWSDWAMPMVFSLATLTLVATVALWAHRWRPLAEFQVIAWLSLAGLAIGFIRRHLSGPEGPHGDLRPTPGGTR